MTSQGLYRPDYEKDACGVGLLVNVKGIKSHRLVEQGLQVLEHMVHRGAEGADPKTGDGAGIMVQIPHEFILLQGVPVPEKGRYGTGLVFMPHDDESVQLMLDLIEREAIALGMKLMATRDVPTDNERLGPVAREAEPRIIQIFVSDEESDDPIEIRLYLLRKIVEKKIAASVIPGNDRFYVVSLSSRTMVYKGMLSSPQLRYYFPDLMNPRFTTAMALVHSRFSTNTFPTWSLAQPFRMLGHNGEINTIQGNRLWMKARECLLSARAFAGHDLTPIIQPGMSDSASLDNVLEFFVMAGMSLPHALAMLVPESFNDKNPISAKLKAFYEYHSILMEAWDGPATLLFSDGRYAGGMLDRNGLRPARWLITANNTMVMASESGVLPFDPSEIKAKGRLRPGKLLMVDMKEGKIYHDRELKEALAQEHPYRDWLQLNRINLDNIRSGRKVGNNVADFRRMLATFGYHAEEVERILKPMIVQAKEPVRSMGDDAPQPLFSRCQQTLYSYFRQHFAQVTNPPVDPLREELVMSLDSYIGAVERSLLDFSPDLCKMVLLRRPIITNRELDLLCNLRYKGFKTRKLAMSFPVEDGADGLARGLQRLCREAEEAVDLGYNYVILTDRGIDSRNAPIPALMATSAVHHHLINCKKRMQSALVVETGSAREVMHFALLVGYGASAVNPYLSFALIDDLVKKKELQLDFDTASRHFVQAVDKGLLKVMSKMGISTLTSYKGAQLFEALGLSREVCDCYFGGTTSSVGGIGIREIAENIVKTHTRAFGTEFDTESPLPDIGRYRFRRGGESHAWNPFVTAALQKAARAGDYDRFREFCRLVDEKEEPVFIRDFLRFNVDGRVPVPVDEVESEESLMRRFVGGAMSFGALSREAHETIAVALNRIGSRSNTGEGGEEPERSEPGPGGESRRSAIKQIASARFGVTTQYLVDADELQIKVAQGAKPGEGGQLPGFKVDEVIARTRHSLPGITLISPPPHHDIYSIEDLAQLIYDLKNVNPSAEVSVKLVSESGVGTIAAGVAKAKSDIIVISGGDGGTGASPASSVTYAGLPVEIGLAETQQTLVLNNLRGLVRLQADGQLKSARDVLVTAMLGAEEFAFGTALLVVLGCVMDHKCHQNTCPMGLTTQNPELRKHFRGDADSVVNYFRFLARGVREGLAAMGFRSLDEVVGHAEYLAPDRELIARHAPGLDLSRLLYMPEAAECNAVRNVSKQSLDLGGVLDHEMISRTFPVIKAGMPVELEFNIGNTDRAVGAMLSGELCRRYGEAGLKEDSVRCTFHGSAGQSFGAFLVPGLSFRLEGDANDYVGKSLCGGKIVIVPPKGSEFAPEENIIAGNTLLYGATSGQVYISGRVGERFCVRNSGAVAVVEGVGDHCCEYMTGGCTVVLGDTGRNFAAGMSGGTAYVWNPGGDFDYYCNMELVELSLVDNEADNRELHRMVSAHYRHTRSPLAGRMLEDWAKYVNEFIKVTPTEYKAYMARHKNG